MVISCRFESLVVTKNVQDTSDGGKIYKVGLVNQESQECGQMFCGQRFFDSVEIGGAYQISGSYNSDLKKFSLQSAMPLKAEK